MNDFVTKNMVELCVKNINASVLTFKKAMCIKKIGKVSTMHILITVKFETTNNVTQTILQKQLKISERIMTFYTCSSKIYLFIFS